ncbi:TetR/AcrR family transcriptional regulator [Actinoplanes sp. TBRC 11911]|uniref:TetR/AcrR family transcriptional regulator n=1 Tax=Actinoplanes sp. TBRC 11911 TaxID=2729386 RepID=UPI00145C542D|nr:TetR/AcrR family transcriptional regulator [Actinoplanes sp. TBRC 11911]NMO51670.1 TetR/AcrR family transcriptional regulator [Actinoplanes sp. TBRC 11911]
MPAIKSRRAPTKGDQREQALLDAARALFQEKSIGKVTIDELATAVGIARSGFYFYFESKQALLAALCDQSIGENDEEMAEWLDSDGHDRDALRRGLRRSLDRWRVDGRWLRELFLAPDPGPDVHAVRERFFTKNNMAFCERIRRDVAAGASVAGPPELLARMVLGLRVITFAHYFEFPEAFTEDEMLETLTEATLRMIYGTTTDQR